MTDQEIFNTLKDILLTIKPKCDESKITPEARLSQDLALDSLSMLMLSLAIENEYKITFDFDSAPKTVQEVIDHVKTKTC